MKKLFLIIFILSPLALLSQNSGPVINTDRPGFSDASRTVPKGYMLIESGFNFQSEQFSPTLTQQLIDFNSTYLRFGLFKGFELRVNQSILAERVLQDGAAAELGWQKGLAPLTVGAKINLIEEKGLLPETALVADFTLPKKQGNFQQQFMEMRLNLTATHSLNPNWVLVYNLGATQLFQANIWQFNYTLKTAYTLENNMTPYFELYGSRSPINPNLNYMNAGFSYLFTNLLQADVSAGIDLLPLYEESPVYRQSFLSVGISYLFKLTK